MAGGFSDLRDADLHDTQIHGRSSPRVEGNHRSYTDVGIRKARGIGGARDLEVPNESPHPNFFAVDFAICAEDDQLVPRLIELQAFPSLFGFQLLLLGCIRKAYPAIPRNWTSSFGGIKDEAYLDLLRQTILAGSDPENVVLLEIEPEKQKTRVDFAATQTLLGVRPVCVTKIKKRGRQLFYDRDGREVQIERIYNRVIFDELIRKPELNLLFQFQDDLDVTWVGHPN